MKTIRATFENGVFRPIEPVELPAGLKVEIAIPEVEDDPVESLKKRFPLSFGCLPDDDAQEMMRIIEEECERIDHDEWK